MESSRRIAGVALSAADQGLVVELFDGGGRRGLGAVVGADLAAAKTLAEGMIGQDPGGWAGRWFRFRGDASASAAMGALEMAAQDLWARGLGRPLYELWGGALRRRIEAAPTAVAAADWRKAANVIAAAERPGLRLILTAPVAVNETGDFARTVDGLGLAYVVDGPFGCRTPIAWRRALSRIELVAAGLKQGALQVMLLDPAAVGGPGGFRRLAALAQAFQVAIAPACRGDLFGIDLAQALHFAAATPEATQGLHCDRGTPAEEMALPEGAGLGVDPDPAAIAGFARTRLKLGAVA
ncbi:MAG: hypothetical protein FJX46_14840 [Alphaproteobacteria bacterium]|nr:hypothetical protein [Alphaproteobacteria bacterium]